VEASALVGEPEDAEPYQDTEVVDVESVSPAADARGAADDPDLPPAPFFAPPPLHTTEPRVDTAASAPRDAPPETPSSEAVAPEDESSNAASAHADLDVSEAETEVPEPIPPMSEQVSPPPGVPRAGASGFFDTSSEPEPEPDRPPPYVGDVIELEHRIDRSEIQSDAPTLPLEARVTIDVEDDDAPLRDEDFPAPAWGSMGGRDSDESVGVRVTVPAEESGAGYPASQGQEIAPPDYEDEEDTRNDDVEAAPNLVPTRSGWPWGKIALVTVLTGVAGFLYGMTTRESPEPDDAARQQRPASQAKTSSDPPHGAAKTPATPSPESKDDAAPSFPVDVAEAERLYRSGEVEAARSVLEQLLAKDPRDARALVLRSSILIEERKLEAALEAATASVAADPELADAHLALGVIRQELGDAKPAADAYRRYLDLAPEGLYATSVKRQLKRLETGSDREGG
jgi:hypothetical protein